MDELALRRNKNTLMSDPWVTFMARLLAYTDSATPGLVAEFNVELARHGLTVHTRLPYSEDQRAALEEWLADRGF